MSQVQISVEENIRGCSNHDMTIQELLALDLTSINQYGSSSLSNNTCIPYDREDFIDPRNCNIGKNDLDIYLPNLGSLKFDPSDYLAIDNGLMKAFGHNDDINKQLSLKSNHVFLSSSVGVPKIKKYKGTQGPIEIVNDLEEEYKARYKSDYFSQDGKVRPPRYVADRLNNHFVLLKIAPTITGHIRIDWVTILNEQNVRFSMPYKFQVNNDLANVSDENPMYKPINTDASRFMQLYLVLIKSKQSEVGRVQSLEVFPPNHQTSNTNHFEKNATLSPKKLIQKYQLEKSQLAFTYCILDTDGKTYIPFWNTTVYSTVMTEKLDDYPKKRRVTCPQCSHLFEIAIDSIDDTGHEDLVKKRKY